jgi:ribosomal protein S18 acetylase RimI-like enzyme
MDGHDIETRWMNRGDVPAAVGILRSEGGDETVRWLNGLLEKPSVMCLVAESDDRVVGVAIYDMARVSKIKVVSFVVEEAQRRRGVGSKMMGLLLSKLNSKRNKAELSVSEYNLGAQLFLRSAGFKAVSVLADNSEASDYKFMYKYSEMAEKGL